MIRDFPDDGIKIVNSSNVSVDNVVSSSNGGGPDPGEGVYISGSDGITIISSFLGTNPSGTTANGNGSDGIDVYSSTNILVLDNVLSGNTGAGFRAQNTTGITLSDNKIGVNVLGASALGNSAQGIELISSVGNISSGNIIGENGFDGIYIQGVGGDVSIVNSYIGTGASGAEDFANNGFGVRVAAGATASITNSKIAYNFQGGIQVGSASSGVDITLNEMYCNNTVGISLQPGANGNISTPVITIATTDYITGTSVANANIEIYEVDNSGCWWGVCEGRNLLGAVVANGSGAWTFNTNLPLGTVVTAIARTASQGTSAFATCRTTVTPPCTHPDKPALKALYEATNGPGWTMTWDTSTCNVCSWYGITCNGSNRVIRLELENNNLSGTLPNINIPTLEVLDLQDNALTGSIPSFNLPNLRELQLLYNQLSGNIPNFNLPSLTSMSLHSNNLMGTIPNFGSMPQLQYLYLSNNQLSGAIPALSSLTNLRHLGLSNNLLQGPLPNFNLSQLSYLFINENNLTGNIPNFNLPALQFLNLSDNQLTGTALLHESLSRSVVS